MKIPLGLLLAVYALLSFESAIDGHSDFSGRVLKASENVPPAHRPDLYFGAGRAIRLVFPGDEIRSREWMGNFS